MSAKARGRPFPEFELTKLRNMLRRTAVRVPDLAESSGTPRSTIYRRIYELIRRGEPVMRLEGGLYKSLKTKVK